MVGDSGESGSRVLTCENWRSSTWISRSSISVGRGGRSTFARRFSVDVDREVDGGACHSEGSFGSEAKAIIISESMSYGASMKWKYITLSQSKECTLGTSQLCSSMR